MIGLRGRTQNTRVSGECTGSLRVRLFQVGPHTQVFTVTPGSWLSSEGKLASLGREAGRRKAALKYYELYLLGGEAGRPAYGQPMEVVRKRTPSGVSYKGKELGRRGRRALMNTAQAVGLS